MSPVRVRALLLLASISAGYLAVVLAWAVAVPPFRGSDERDHVFRSDAVAHGHVLPEYDDREGARGGLLPVRRSVVDAARPACLALTYLSAEDCRAAGSTSSATVLIPSGAARYNPSYYVVAGLAARPFDGGRAMWAMRVATAVMCATMIGVAFAISTARSRTSWPTAGLILTLTPTATFSAGVATPNGLHLIAATLVWLSALGLRDVLDEGRDPPRLLWYGLALGCVSMIHTHSLGVLWAGLILVACAVSADDLRGVLRRAAHSAPRLLTLGVAIAGVAGLVWSFAFNPNDPAREHSLADVSAFPGVLIQPFLWFLQSFVTTSGNWELASWWIYVAALVVVSGLLVLAVPRASSRERRALAFVVALWVVVPTCLTLATLQQMGFAWQGRYSLPLALGVVMLACQALDRSTLVRRGPPLAAAAASVALMTVGAQAWWMRDQRSATTLALTALATMVGFAVMAVSARLLTARSGQGSSHLRREGVVPTDYSDQSFGSVPTLGTPSDVAGF